MKRWMGFRDPKRNVGVCKRGHLKRITEESKMDWEVRAYRENELEKLDEVRVYDECDRENDAAGLFYSFEVSTGILVISEILKMLMTGIDVTLLRFGIIEYLLFKAFTLRLIIFHVSYIDWVVGVSPSRSSSSSPIFLV